MSKPWVLARENPESHRLHVVPEFPGEPVHVDSVECWCEPELDYRDANNGGEVWAHRRPM